MRTEKRLQRLTMAAILLSMVVGCSQVPVRNTDAPQAVEKPTETALPEVELNQELLYQLLVAEFSGQHGALRLSASAYLETARKTQDYRLARRATRIAIYGRQHEIALEAAQLWVKLEPQNREAHKSAAAMLIASDQGELARPHLEELLKGKRHDNNHGYPLVATLLESSPNKGWASKTMEELVSLEPRSAYALYAQARLTNKLGAPQDALQILDKLLEQHPEHHDGIILQARIKHGLGDQSGALASMKKAITLSPDKQQLRMTYARMLIEARQLDEARNQFKLLAKKAPNDVDVIYALGLLALEDGDLDSAEAQFQKLLDSKQREDDSRYAMAQITEAKGDYQKAITWYSSITHGERYLDSQLQAVRLILELKGLSAARQHLQQLTPQSDDERVELYLADAQLLGKANQHEAAIAIYDQGLEKYPHNEELLYARAIAGEEIGRLDILERDLKHILRLKPNNARALNALGYTLADRTTRYQEAYEYISRAYQQRPSDFAILDSMGWVLYRMGKTEEALKFLQRAFSQFPDGEIGAHLGEVLWETGNRLEAHKVWDRALKHDPDNKVLQQTIQRFKP